jgi:hypothetical protein
MLNVSQCSPWGAKETAATMQARPAPDCPAHGRWQFDGFLGDRLKGAVA